MTHQTKTYKGKKYFVLPALSAGFCDGCVFYERGERDADGLQCCPYNDERSKHYESCTGNHDGVTDLIWILPIKQALADYIAKKLEGA